MPGVIFVKIRKVLKKEADLFYEEISRQGRSSKEQSQQEILGKSFS
jgi:hypothetical protein